MKKFPVVWLLLLVVTGLVCGLITEHIEMIRLRHEVSRLRRTIIEPATGGIQGVPPSQPVLLTSNEGRRFLGDQLRSFQVDADGVIGTTKDAWISLHDTEGKAFRLTGELWLGGASATSQYPEDLPDGFALFLREWDSLHRYGITTRSIVNKRRQWPKGQEQDIVAVTDFQEPARGQWLRFLVEATAERIAFRVGNQMGTLPGPLDLDGANKIALAPGTRLRDVRIQILPEPAAGEAGR